MANLWDRKVHAVMKDGSEIVRYDKAGKWYREWPETQHRPASRKALSLRGAVDLAVGPDADDVRLNLPGGGSFDRWYREVHRIAGLDVEGMGHERLPRPSLPDASGDTALPLPTDPASTG